MKKNKSVKLYLHFKHYSAAFNLMTELYTQGKIEMREIKRKWFWDTFSRRYYFTIEVGNEYVRTIN